MSGGAAAGEAMSSEAVHATVAGGMHTLWLNRGQRGNALSAEMVEALIVGVERACADPAARLLVLRTSAAHLCTGFDLTGLDEQSDADLLMRFVRIETLLSMLWNAPVRTLAIAGGRTWGAGADIFVACDERWILPQASFRFPGAAFGIVLGSRRLAERIGTSQARRLIASGATMSGEDALTCGLAGRAFSAAELESALTEEASALRLDAPTYAAVSRATRNDRSDADLAALVRSASAPGLAKRLRAYRDHVNAVKTRAPL
ncbi:MAG: enoyl-CoA hydratase/isomerase family protein [Noviherbaspirillum sp.]